MEPLAFLATLAVASLVLARCLMAGLRGAT
jgi:hypothetical protein